MSTPADAEKNILPTPDRGLISIIPAAIISALALAAAGGFDVWREISASPMMQNQSMATSPTQVASSPANAPIAAPKLPSTEKAPSASRYPISTFKQEQSILWERPPGRDKPYRGREAAPTPASGAPSATAAQTETAAAPAPPIHIEHSQEGGTVDPILLSAWQAYHNGDFDIASLHYSAVLRKDVQNHNPPNRDALLGMAAIAQQRSQDASAAQYYREVLALDPRDPEACAGMFSLRVTTGAADAESRLKLLLAQHPEAATLHFALGNHYAEQSRWGDAQQEYFRACALESDNARFAFNLAVSLDHLGQSKLAALHYQRALQLDSPDSGKTNPANTGFDHAQTQLRLDELTSH